MNPILRITCDDPETCEQVAEMMVAQVQSIITGAVVATFAAIVIHRAWRMAR